MKNTPLLEQIDACRPGERDLTQPEFADLAARLEHDPAALRSFRAVQEFDGALVAALEDVPVPAGLADRLLAAARSHAEPAVSLPPRRARYADLLEWVVPLAVLALFAVAIGLNSFSPPGPITPDQFVQTVEGWQGELQHDHWNERLKAAPRSEFPLGPHVTLSPRRWQQLQLDGAEIVAYHEGPPDSILFVTRLKTKVSNLSDSPKLISSTGGYLIGAWQAGDLTYVLVVEGDKRRYESHLKTHAAA